MPIENREELVAAVAEAGRLLQEINDYASQNEVDGRAVKVRFPTGFLRTAYTHQRGFDFVADARLRQNLSYALMMHDVLRWLVTRTSIGLQARDMIIKEGICLLGSVIETVTVFRGERGLGRNSKLGDRIQRLVELEVIDGNLPEDVLWVWEIRCREHLMDVQVWEWNHYALADWEKSVRAYNGLLAALRAWRGARDGDGRRA